MTINKPIIIVEGVWGVGKTRFIHGLLSEHDYVWLKEPDHIIEKFQAKHSEDLFIWYFNRHVENLDIAQKNLEVGKYTVIERTIISSFAFASQILNWNGGRIQPYFQCARELNFANVHVVYIPITNMSRCLDHMMINPAISKFATVDNVEAVDDEIRKFKEKLNL